MDLEGVIILPITVSVLLEFIAQWDRQVLTQRTYTRKWNYKLRQGL